MEWISIKVYDPRKGHDVEAGEYCTESSTFYKVLGKGHILQLPEPSIAISKSAIYQLVELGCQYIRCDKRQSQDGCYYYISFSAFLDNAVDDYRNGQQYAGDSSEQLFHDYDVPDEELTEEERERRADAQFRVPLTCWQYRNPKQEPIPFDMESFGLKKGEYSGGISAQGSGPKEDDSDGDGEE